MTFKRIISSVGVGAGAIVLGLGIQYALAQTSGSWTSAPPSPPNGNVPAPINVGSANQAKVGWLSLGTTSTASASGPLDVEGVGYIKGLIVGNGTPSPIQIVDAGAIAGQDSGKVLTSDANGNASWSQLQQTSGGACNESSTTLTANTVYQNTTGTKMIVVAYLYNTSASNQSDIKGQISSDGSAFTTVNESNGASGGGAYAYDNVTFVVPPGYYYRVVPQSSGATIAASAWQICEGGSAGGGVKVYAAKGTTNIYLPTGTLSPDSTSGGANCISPWYDIQGLSVNVQDSNPSAANYAATVSMSIRKSSYVQFRILVDGNTVGETNTTDTDVGSAGYGSYNIDPTNNTSTTTYVGSYGVGGFLNYTTNFQISDTSSHTVKVQWRGGGGACGTAYNSYQDGSLFPRTLTVIGGN